jgi:YihY family inner membrane protein
VNPVERLVRRIDAFQQRHRPLAFVFAVVKKYGDDRGSTLAALLAYYGFLAVFPLLLLLTTLLGYVLSLNPRLEQSLLDSALVEFPIIGSQLGEAIRPLRGSGLGLIVGFLLLMWGAMGIAQAAQHAMAEVWNIPGVLRPNFVTRLARGLRLFAVLGLGVAATTFLANVPAFGITGLPAQLAGAVGSVAINIGLYLLAFRVLTVREVQLHCLIPGAVAGGIGWSILQAAGGYLVASQLRNASQVYGYFGSVIGLISWLGLGAQLTLYAAELNVVLARRLWPRSIVQPPLTGADMEHLAAIAKQEERRPEESVSVEFRDDEAHLRGPAAGSDVGSGSPQRNSGAV